MLPTTVNDIKQTKKAKITIWRKILIAIKILSLIGCFIGAIILWIAKIFSLELSSIYIGPIVLSDILIVINGINTVYQFSEDNNIYCYQKTEPDN